MRRILITELLVAIVFLLHFLPLFENINLCIRFLLTYELDYYCIEKLVEIIIKKKRNNEHVRTHLLGTVLATLYKGAAATIGAAATMGAAATTLGAATGAATGAE